MRLVFVHGINHQNKTSDWIVDNWLKALGTHLSAADKALLQAQEVVAPYYGDVLHQHTEGLAAAGDELTPQGAGDVAGDEANFYRDVLTEIAKEKAIPESLIVANEPVAEQGPIFHNRRIIAIAQAIEALSPLHGKVVLRVLPQAFTYLNRIQATKAVDDIVRPALKDQPSIVVAHSLGTIVTFKLMRELRHNAPFYMTMGSPLAIRAVQGPISTPFGRRANVQRWLNVYDKDDFVTLSKPLDSTTFGGGVENTDVDNGADDPHDFREYLAHPDVANALVAAIKAAT